MAYVDSNRIDSNRCKAIAINHNTASARGTEFVCHLLPSKRIIAKVVITRIEDDVLAFRVNQKVTIEAANGTVAVDDLVIREGGDVYGVSHGTAVAIGIITFEFRNG
jgi:hypothetical protein